MFCKNCGQQINENADFCLNCGTAKGNGDKYCANCGGSVNPEQDICLKCGSSLKSSGKSGTSFGGSKKNSTGSFKRKSEGKLLGGVCTGLEEKFGINVWLARVLVLFIPFAWLA